MCEGVAVSMEYIGNKRAGVTFLGKYVGADNEFDKFACVDPNDVARLERSGQWRVALPTAPALPDDGSDLTADAGDLDAPPGEGVGAGAEGIAPAIPGDAEVKAAMPAKRRKG